MHLLYIRKYSVYALCARLSPRGNRVANDEQSLRGKYISSKCFPGSAQLGSPRLGFRNLMRGLNVRPKPVEQLLESCIFTREEGWAGEKTKREVWDAGLQRKKRWQL